MKNHIHNKLLISVVVIGTFVFIKSSYLPQLTAYMIGSSYQEMSRDSRLLIHYTEWLILISLAVLSLNRFRFKSLVTELGLASGMMLGIGIAFLATLPMLIGSALTSQLSSEISLMGGVLSALLPGTMEEILYRGFLFGLLFRRAGWGFIPAVAINAIFFGMGHLYQGSDFGTSLGIFCITLMGAGWFAWLYIEWDNCLWLPIGLHVFMNLWWGLFSVSDTALGGIYANIFRGIVIAITVILTIRRRRQLGTYRVHKGSLFIHNE